MKPPGITPLLATALLAMAHDAAATDLTIHLAGTAAMTHKTVEYKCDANGAQIGVPATPFTVEYIYGGGNSLVVVPMAGNSVIFSNVSSASGARYTAQTFTWWEAHGTVTLYSDGLTGKSQSACQPVKSK
jgi:membrane-bound inhibitor of C-type lysozyme